IERQLNKKIFNKHINFFRLVMSHWFHNSSNDTEIRRFYNNLKTVFKKVSIPNGIEKNEWHMDY
ncbi:AAA family ATPase, partial [Citrobacter freundii]|nr:AAA family ATPase [Citrobacter freundii]